MDMTLELSAKQREMLDVLRGADTWLDRNEIAALIGRNRLNPHDLEVLEGLVSSGLIDRKTEIAGIAEKYIYRINS